MELIGGAIIMVIPQVAFVYGVLGMIYSTYSWRKYIPFILYFVFILSYVYEPIGSPDLVRYFAIIEECGKQDFIEVINYCSNGLFIENFLFWIFGKYEQGHLLVAISTTTVYSVAMYITCDTCEEYDNHKYTCLIILFQMMLIPYVSVVNNLLNIWAFSLEVLAVYLELVKKKKIIFLIPLYIIPCFLHDAAIILLLLRLLIFLAQKVKLFTLVIVLVAPTVINIAFLNVYRIGNTGIGIVVKTLIKKSYWYFNDPLTSEYSRRIASSNADKLNRAIMILLAIVCIFLIYHLGDKLTKARVDFNTFVFLLCVLTIALLPVNTPQYWRSSVAIVITIASLVCPCFDCIFTKFKIKQIIMISAPFFMIFGMFIQIWNSRYIVNYIQLFSESMITNLYTIICHLVIHIF